MERNFRPMIAKGMSVIIFGWLLVNSVFFVDTKEVGVVYRLGKWSRTHPAGLHFCLPYPLEKVEKWPIINTRSVDIHMPRILTGDANLIDAHLVVQYDILKAESFVLSHEDTDTILQIVMQSTLIRVVGHSKVDQDTFVNRNLLEKQIRLIGEEEIIRMNLGISLSSVGFQELSAPTAVIDAFNEISSARGEKDTMVLSAQSYASKAIPAAGGEGNKILEEARVYSTNIQNEAKIRTERFDDLLDVWVGNPEMLRSTLRAQTWDSIKEKVTVHYVSEGDHLILPSKPRKEK
jgi:modulator of FtsH protease HflK